MQYEPATRRCAISAPTSAQTRRTRGGDPLIFHLPSAVVGKQFTVVIVARKPSLALFSDPARTAKYKSHRFSLGGVHTCTGPTWAVEDARLAPHAALSEAGRGVRTINQRAANALSGRWAAGIRGWTVSGR